MAGAHRLCRSRCARYRLVHRTFRRPRTVGHKVALQGNLDPNVLFARPSAIRAEVARVLESYGHGPGHVFNLGHGISQFTNPDHVTAFMEALHDLSPQYHQSIPTQTDAPCPGAK